MADKVLKDVRSDLIQYLTLPNIKQLLDKLTKEGPNQPRVLNKEEADCILEENPSRTDKVRDLIDSVTNKGAKASSILIDELKSIDPQLDNKLELGTRLKKILKNSREAEKTSHDPEVAVGTHTDEDHGDEEYPMNSIPRGYCVIINNELFTKEASLCGLISSETTTRDGTNKDADDLEKVFTFLGFKVERHQDLTAKEMKELIITFRDKPDHGDCFVCCVLSHGDKNGVLGTDWKLCPMNDIISPLDGKNCPSLAGKPKVFFIQACRGHKRQEKVTVTADNADEAKESYTIPKDSDFLISMSTVDDYVSYRSEEGSLFVQSLCPHLEEGSRRGDDILSILTKVNMEVSRKEGTEYITVKGKKQKLDVKMTPEPRFTLTKKLIFRIPPRKMTG